MQPDLSAAPGLFAAPAASARHQADTLMKIAKSDPPAASAAASTRGRTFRSTIQGFFGISVPTDTPLVALDPKTRSEDIANAVMARRAEETEAVESDPLSVNWGELFDDAMDIAQLLLADTLPEFAQPLGIIFKGLQKLKALHGSVVSLRSEITIALYIISSVLRILHREAARILVENSVDSAFRILNEDSSSQLDHFARSCEQFVTYLARLDKSSGAKLFITGSRTRRDYVNSRLSELRAVWDFFRGEKELCANEAIMRLMRELAPAALQEMAQCEEVYRRRVKHRKGAQEDARDIEARAPIEFYQRRCQARVDAIQSDIRTLQLTGRGSTDMSEEGSAAMIFWAHRESGTISVPEIAILRHLRARLGLFRAEAEYLSILIDTRDGRHHFPLDQDADNQTATEQVSALPSLSYEEADSKSTSASSRKSDESAITDSSAQEGIATPRHMEDFRVEPTVIDDHLSDPFSAFRVSEHDDSGSDTDKSDGTA